ncbi:flagellar hook-length control protein FliK [Pseudomonas oryzae]|uniref:Flagellar hook-length control protein FliK n=1 Tax=Pseudomonas oryzae TaxID=1392877 RepID=A0A1H1NNY4_9PSED|nr:flagellar hook-length control protein FliK [Pseudomonas oryzae]SDS00761.1 flagellar hook-length control protein FliK [Pseudomonas oryzae]
MDISIIGAAPSAGAQPRSSQGPATGTDRFARHLQQAHAAAGDAGAASASPAAKAPAKNSASVADTRETQTQPLKPDDNAPPAEADMQSPPAPAHASTLADTGANAAPLQPLDALDEIRRRLALIEQAGQLPGAESAAAIAPLQAAAIAAQTPGGSPLAATPVTAGHSPESIAAVAGASSRQTLLQPSTREASATGAGLPLAAQDPTAPGLAVDAAAPAQAGAETGSDIAATPAVTSSLADAAPGSAATGNGLPPSGLPPSGMAPSAMPPGTPTLAGMAGGAAPSAILAAPLASREWQQDLGRQLIGLHQRGEQQIELHLHPSELGPLSVSLKLGELGAQAQFLSAHPQVRAAVEQALPQLREALAAQGINLGETSVGAQHQPQGEQQAGGGTGNRQGSDLAAVPGDGDEPRAPLAPRTLRGQVDLYA